MATEAFVGSEKAPGQPGARRRDSALRAARKRPVRIAFVLRSFTYGGAEHDIIQLLTDSDPAQLSFVGMAVQTPYPICPELRLDDARVPTIYQPDAITTHAKVIRSESFASAVGMVAAQADIIIAWGVPDLADVIPLGYRGRIVVTSKASGEYQESFLHANALCTADLVANSVKSTEAFPSAVRSRARVIYPGIDGRRLVRSCDRDELRAAWGMGPGHRIVGYLGRIAPDKGVDRLVDAVSRMGSTWRAVFVGRNGNFPEYERNFARHCRRKLPGRHRIVNWTTEIGNALSAFDVLAYPTEDEGFSNTLAEAWWLGVPTVSTAGVGALAESHWSACATTISHDFTESELRQALRAACRDRTRVARARRRARALTVDAAIRVWQQYLTELASTSRPTRAMVLLPNALIGGMTSWLTTLMQRTPRIDWCCLGVLSETPDYACDREVVDEMVRAGCPVVGIPNVPANVRRQRLANAIRQTRPDVVLQCGVKRVDDFFPDLGIPLVTISHGPADCAWARTVLARSSRRAARRVAVSTTARNAFPADLRSGVSIIANGVPVPPVRDLSGHARLQARLDLGLKPSDIAVGYVGRLSPEKNPQAVARAVARLPHQFRAVFLGPDCGDQLQRIQRITSRHLHRGPLTGEHTRQLLPGLDVLVCASDYESFGLAIVEAWAALVPVVSTRVGVVAELADSLDVAVVVPVRPSAQTLAQAICQALEERARRIHVCRKLAREEYHCRRMGDEWQRLLEEVASSALTDGPQGGRLQTR